MNDNPEISYAPRAKKGSLTQADADDLIGTALGRYLLLRRLGKGGMGVVYEAEDHLLNRRVAVKLLPRSDRPGARMLERFFVEAQVAARLCHPNIIGIYDIGERSGTFYIVMELLNEQSLGGYLRLQGALSWQEATRIAADCCAALHDAHLAGLVHRDIKPDNILCSPSGVVKVADFGLVKELTHSAPDGTAFTQDGAVVGSPQYMSPEQCRSQPVDNRSDIYSLGATFYSMLTGRPPFGFGASMQLMVHHCSTPTPDPRQHAPEVPQACVDILERSMKKEPEERYHTAEEMRQALEAVIEGTARPPYTFVVPHSVARQAVRQRRADELLAALEAEHGDGPTIDAPADEEEGAIGDQSSQKGAIEKAALAATAPRPPTEAPSPAEIDSSDDKRLAMLEAALAMAPTAPITPPKRPVALRRAYRKSVLLGVALLTLPALLAVALYFGQLRRLLGDDLGGRAAERPLIKVGVVHSLTGSMSQMARPVIDATLLAIDDLNEQGGLLGRSIEAVVIDGKSEAETFAAATERLLLRDQMHVIFGGLHSEGRQGIQKVVERNDQLLLYPGDAEGLEESPNTFYLGGVPSQRIEPALRHVTSKLEYKRFFLVGHNLPSTRALHAMLHEQLKELGGKVVGERQLSRGALDFGSMWKKIASAEPELIINTLRGDANVDFFRAWQKRDKRLRGLRVLSLTIDENILSLLEGVDLTENYVAGSYFQSVPRPENAAFIERFRKKYGTHRVITENMEAAYSSVLLWAQAVRECGDVQPAKVRPALRAQTLSAPSAEYRFAGGNYAWKPFHLARIGAGNKLELIESSSELLPPQLYPGSRTRAQWESLFNRM